MFFLLRAMRREMHAMQVQSEAWVRIHNHQQQVLECLQDLRADVAVTRRRTCDALDTLFQGLEFRKHLGMLSNTHDMIMELHGRRGALAEVQHLQYVRNQLQELRQQVRHLQDTMESASTAENQLPIVRLSVPAGSELQLL